MDEILYKAAVGAVAGGIIAAVVWVVQRVRNGPAPAPLTRDQMIAGLRAIIDDPQASPIEREKAASRLKALNRT